MLMPDGHIVQLSLTSVLASINLAWRTGLGGLLNPSVASFVSPMNLSQVRPWAHGAIYEYAEFLFPFLNQLGCSWLLTFMSDSRFPNGSKLRALLELSLVFSLGERNL